MAEADRLRSEMVALRTLHGVANQTISDMQNAKVAVDQEVADLKARNASLQQALTQAQAMVQQTLTEYNHMKETTLQRISEQRAEITELKAKRDGD